jgi:hypothetical protein
MHTTHVVASRRFLLALPAVALALLALAAPEARAGDQQFCFGTTQRIAPTTERDTGVSYAFKCSLPITHFGLVDTVKLSSFDVTADVFDPPELGGGIRGDDRFGECVGAIPSYGFTCSGQYSGFSRQVRGTFDAFSDPCARTRTGRLKSRAAIVVQGSDGSLAGPFGLGRPKGCAKAAAHRRRAHRS